jgi:transcriptional regulator
MERPGTMHTPAHFSESRPEILRDLMAQHPLATIVSHSGAGLVADHVPLLHEAGAGAHGRLIGHVAKANPLWRTPPEREHLVIFQGPSAYISPGWYATKAEAGRVVPTWNYAVVHATAMLTAFHDARALLALLAKLTDRHEHTRPQPWRVTDAPADYVERLLENIVGIELHITRLEGKWKVSQNQSAANRRGVVGGLAAEGGDDAVHMARLVEKFGGEAK